MYDIDQIKKLLRQRLSEKRYTHCLNVAQECIELAKKYGADEEKAYFDICKEIPADELRQQAIDSDLGMTVAEKKTKALWHAVAGAGYVRDELKINDTDIINAVRFHTVARAGMSKLEEVVYIGDLISADRNYKDVKRIRKLAYQDLDIVMLEALVFSIGSVIEKKGLIPDYTLQAYNQYVYINGIQNEERK